MTKKGQGKEFALIFFQRFVVAPVLLASFGVWVYVVVHFVIKYW
jgi:hypothetical protein